MSEEIAVREKAERIRDVIRYLKKFKNALVIIYIDDNLLDSPLFLSHIKDICLIHESGLKVIVVPGASKRIDEILTASNFTWTIHNNCRITDSQAMPLIKMAAFDVSNQIMTAFAGEKQTAVIGNWVRARGKGVIDGFDYGDIGEIDKLNIESIQTVLDNGFIPIFPCIGWSMAGKPYNISSQELAKQIAVHLKADKLFYLLPNASINAENFTIPKEIGTSPEGTVPSLNLEEVSKFIVANSKTNELSVKITNNTNKRLLVKDRILTLLSLAVDACKNGVNRVHILNGSLDGTVPCEIFSDLGSGTMIYINNYGGIRSMTRSDIPTVLKIMKPFVDSGILLPRTRQNLLEQLQNYIVYELDGAVRACASLIPYSDSQMEIAGVAVEKTYSHIGVGPKMISFLIQKAKNANAKNVFLLTTQTADWFEQQGFKPASLENLPLERKKLWNPNRASKLFVLPL